MSLLVINTGSTSLKYRRFETPGLKTIEAGNLSWGSERRKRRATVRGLVARCLEDPPVLDVVAHRVVHGGEHFRRATLIDEGVLERFREIESLAPLHNPASIDAIETCRALAPDLPQVAVFDTAFHRTLPPEAFMYALPWADYAKHRVRRYGFHGISNQAVARRVPDFLGKAPEALNLISLHLGGGSSVTAIRGAQSVDTSMGMTPLEGLPMSTRSGDLDPALGPLLQRAHKLDTAGLERRLYEESGMLGLAGTGDMRTLLGRASDGDERAGLALALYCYRARKYIGAYVAVLGKVHALVFTGGIGANAPGVRAGICSGLGFLGVSLCDARNQENVTDIAAIHADDSALPVLAVRADEETEIARQARALLSGRSQAPGP